MNEIIDISVDKELGIIEVAIRVPQFENFGKRLGELERKAAEAFRDQSEPESNPELEAETEADLNETIKSLNSNVSTMMKEQLDAMPDGPQKKAMMQAYEEFMKTTETEDEENEPDEGAPADETRFDYDLQLLRVTLSGDMKWDKAAESKVEQFLADWPSVRPVVLRETFKYYKKIYPQLFEIFGGSNEHALTLPKPTGEEVVADLFTISAIYLHEDGRIGLGGHCTWDEEHGYGVKIKNRKVVGVGHESDAFS